MSDINGQPRARGGRPSHDDFVLSDQDGPWSYDQLQAMNAEFIAKIEQAFESGRDRRSSAENEVKVRTAMPRGVSPLTKEIWAGLLRSNFA
jgi:hypothetical protein